MNDELFQYVVRLMPFTSSYGLGLSSNFGVGSTYLGSGSPTLSTSASKYYAAADSLRLDSASSQYVFVGSPGSSVIGDANIVLGSSDWCIECWVNPISHATARTILSNYRPVANGYGFTLYTNASGHVLFSYGTTADAWASTVGGASSAISTGVWTHVAMVREGNTLRMYTGGVQRYSSAVSGSGAIKAATVTGVYIGMSLNASSVVSEAWNGYMQDFRLTIGHGRYLSGTAFTPPDRLVGLLSGEVRDSAGAVASRKVIAVPRLGTTSRVTTSAGDGTYSIGAARTEHTVIAVSNDNTLPDLVLRRLPA